MSLVMPAGLCKRWCRDTETSTLTLRQNKADCFRNLIISFFQRLRTDCKIEWLFATGRNKLVDSLIVDGFSSHCFLCYWIRLSTLPLSGITSLLSLKKVSSVVSKNSDGRLGTQIQVKGKGVNALQKWQRELWRLFKTDNFFRRAYTRKVSKQRFTCRISTHRTYKENKVVRLCSV